MIPVVDPSTYQLRVGDVLYATEPSEGSDKTILVALAPPTTVNEPSPKGLNTLVPIA